MNYFLWIRKKIETKVNFFSKKSKYHVKKSSVRFAQKKMVSTALQIPSQLFFYSKILLAKASFRVHPLRL